MGSRRGLRAHRHAVRAAHKVHRSSRSAHHRDRHPQHLTIAHHSAIKAVKHLGKVVGFVLSAGRRH